MKTELKKIDKLKRIVTIQVDSDTLTQDKETIYKELSKTLKVPGFRPGTAPIHVLEKHHRQTLEDELLRRVIPAYYSKALEENNLEVVGAPRIFDVDFKEELLSFSVEIETKPEVTLDDTDYKNIKVRAKAVTVEEIEIEKLITQLKDTVKKITKKDYQDEELARWAGYADVTTFKEAIRAQMLVDKLRARRADMENAVVEELLKKIKLDVPQSLVEEQFKKLLEQELYGLRMRGIEDKDIKKYEDDLKEKIRPVARKQVAIYYILEAIAKKENLAADIRSLFESVMGFILSNASYTK